ncbi:hypothetical protein BCR33DRAFT_807623 [Rhizoclosmatium globosum]|uniref:SH3 domain-containing protein n=1 Tax=Rhizoclosmatium globosum TaxID=329046 RepID=A0A1Y2CJT6_9FUNG|nr:hypothetical protein BCR33DRAFT_807623 [Rhizoclosmatium globosum]|eukprot:ORY47289.1 hypothetical protein BCR33DRAFT_807623 [Rhizoclosmatium globosum]
MLTSFDSNQRTTSVAEWASRIGGVDVAAGLGCSGGSSKGVQFVSTYQCVRDVVVLSKGCNKQLPSPALCSDTCDALGASLNAYIGDTDNCKPVAFNSDAANARAKALNAAANCKQTVLDWQKQTGSSDSKCTESITLDYESCGFGGNYVQAKAYCTAVKNSPSCCDAVNKASIATSNNKTDTSASNRVSTGSATNSNSNNEIIAGSSFAASDSSTPTTGNPAPTQDPSSSNSDSGLSVGAKVGIAIGVVLLVALIASCWIVYTNRFNIFPSNHPVLKFLGDGGRPSYVKRGASSQYRNSVINLQGGSSSSTTLTTTTVERTYVRIPDEASTGVAIKGEHVVKIEYVASLPDELSVKIGDVLTITEAYDDGWAKGRKSNGTEGLFPLSCVGIDTPVA